MKYVTELMRAILSLTHTGTQTLWLQVKRAHTCHVHPKPLLPSTYRGLRSIYFTVFPAQESHLHTTVGSFQNHPQHYAPGEVSFARGLPTPELPIIENT